MLAHIDDHPGDNRDNEKHGSATETDRLESRYSLSRWSLILLDPLVLGAMAGFLPVWSSD